MILTIHLSALAYVGGGEPTEYFDLVEESLTATGLDFYTARARGSLAADLSLPFWFTDEETKVQQGKGSSRITEVVSGSGELGAQLSKSRSGVNSLQHMCLKTWKS